MATNITKETSDAVQLATHAAFVANSWLDRCKSVLNADLACPNFSAMIHALAHKYLYWGDLVGDLIENYNQAVVYGGVETRAEEYKTPVEVIDKVFEVVIDYQNQLNKCADIAKANTDVHVYEGLLKVIKKHDKYVEAVINWRDIAHKYGVDPTFDHDVKHYDI